MARTLGSDERALWAKVIETVRPLDRTVLPAEAEPIEALPAPRPAKLVSVVRVANPRKAVPGPGTTLDGGWDRKLLRGALVPDQTIDLHGHNLGGAHARLDRALDEAVASEARVLLLITGHAPRGEPPIRRGAIRAAVGDWLAASRHAANIAAVRGAHPRHGGGGALYIVLRRRRN